MRNKLFRYGLIIAAILFGACEEIVEKPITDQKISLLSPVNGVISEDSSQLFYWEPLTDSARYQLQVVQPSFDSLVRLETDTIIFQNKLRLLLRNGAYQWRVRALNNSVTSRFSDTWNLTIK